MIAHINHFFIALLTLCIVPVAFHYYTVHGMVSIKVSTELYISGFIDLTLVCELSMLYIHNMAWKMYKGVPTLWINVPKYTYS